jgi:acetaldehyde dehydrogenase (acetylating)
MQFIKQFFGSSKNLVPNSNTVQPQRLRVAIIGTGKIGTDLLIKVQRSKVLECVIFVGRNLASPGMQTAAALGVKVSDQGIDAFRDPSNACDIVFDATSAANHLEHAPLFDMLGIFAIDMTPSQIGECCVPAISLSEIASNTNISMISCGGQSSIPIAHVLAKVIPNIQQISVRSVVSANSVGPGTLANIDEYYHNTSVGLKKYTGLENFAVDLQVDEINLETRMYTSIYARTDFTDLAALQPPLLDMVQKLQAYVPGYKVETAPVRDGEGIRVDISVEGLGDYLPKYAGNLDIINCAAIAVAEEYAQARLYAREVNKSEAPRTTANSLDN